MKREPLQTRWRSAWWFQMWLLITMTWGVMLATYMASNFPFAAGDAEFKVARAALDPAEEGVLASSAETDAVSVKGGVGITYKFRRETNTERIRLIAQNLDASIAQTLSEKRKAFAARFFWVFLSVPVVGFAVFFLIGIKRREI